MLKLPSDLILGALLKLLYFLLFAAMKVAQALPLVWVARLGRAGGMVFYWLDFKHRRVALRNLHDCFGAELAPAAIRALARENFRRIGENYTCAVTSAAMGRDELARHAEFVGFERAVNRPDLPATVGRVFAIGHFGNFELYARAGQFLDWYRAATTFRGIGHAGLDRLMRTQRERNGALFFERRSEADALRDALGRAPLLLGLLADQHAGGRGLRLPFFGRPCSTSPAPAVYALRYRMPLYTAICFRTGLGRWRIELGDEIPTRDADDRPRPVEAIMLDVNRAFEQAIRRDPANWFWVHRRWKPVESPRNHPPHPASPPPPHRPRSAAGRRITAS